MKLDPSQIIQAEKDNNPFSVGSTDTNTNLSSQQLGAGTYTIYKIDRVGGSRDGDFYDEAVCIGKGGILPTQVAQANPGYSLGSQ